MSVQYPLSWQIRVSWQIWVSWQIGVSWQIRVSWQTGASWTDWSFLTPGVPWQQISNISFGELWAVVGCGWCIWIRASALVPLWDSLGVLSFSLWDQGTRLSNFVGSFGKLEFFNCPKKYRTHWLNKEN